MEVGVGVAIVGGGADGESVGAVFFVDVVDFGEEVDLLVCF